jgi:hypothetical protein
MDFHAYLLNDMTDFFYCISSITVIRFIRVNSLNGNANENSVVSHKIHTVFLSPSCCVMESRYKVAFYKPFLKKLI